MSKISTILSFFLILITLGFGGAHLIEYWSPKNSRRPEISNIQYIILHTTEGGAEGSLSKLWSRGEAHFMVNTDGTVYELIKTDRLAKHAGRSLWNGTYDIDRVSIGIEVVGFHDALPTESQVDALSILLSKLKKKYKVPDDHILSHSMVAYGAPNKWFHFNHRGRKACGMLFATSQLRARLGLTSKPASDPDVTAGRVRIADSALAQVLYGRNDSSDQVAYQKYVKASTVVEKNPLNVEKATDTLDSSESPDGFQTIGTDHPTAYSIAGNSYAKETTIYFFPTGEIETGINLMADQAGQQVLAHLPHGTTILVGYIYGGEITQGRLPNRIAKERWNYPSTYYRLTDGTIKSGDDIDPHAIPQGTLIFFQQ